MNVPTTSSGYFTNSEPATKNSVKTFLLPDNCFEKRAACTWRNGNRFTIYPRSQTVTNKNLEEIENKIVNVQQEVVLFSHILRKLVNESNGTYLMLQKIAEAATNSDNQVEFMKLSRQYRSILRVCIPNLQETATAEKDYLEKNKLMSFITIFYSIECIWHLCEILFIDNVPGDVVLPFLLDWVRFHFPNHEHVASDILEACERGSEVHEEYWDTVIGMVVQGRVDVVRSLLRLHSSADTNEFRLVDNTLKTMPNYSVYAGISAGEFQINWKHWQSECRAKLNSRTLVAHPNLELILRLSIGEYSAFESIRDRYESWYDLLGGWVMYNAPWCRRHELAEHAHACAGMRSSKPGLAALDLTILAICENDLHQVIHGIQDMSDNGWFATHLTDLLYHCGKLKILDKHQNDVTTHLRNSLVLEYGSILMEHQSLWTIGLSYLAGCQPEGPRVAELLLERLPVRTEARAMRIIAEAKRHGLDRVVQTVSACMSSSRKTVGARLSWAVRARSPTLCARVADVLLRRFVDTRQLDCADILLTLGPAMLLSDRLLFLGKYCEFHRQYKNRDFKNGGKLLVSLLTSKIAPDYFWDTLLLDSIPLLESDEEIFSAQDTCEIMLCLELKPNSLDSEKADILRLALARNLARTSLTSGRPEIEPS